MYGRCPALRQPESIFVDLEVSRARLHTPIPTGRSRNLMPQHRCCLTWAHPLVDLARTVSTMTSGHESQRLRLLATVALVAAFANGARAVRGVDPARTIHVCRSLLAAFAWLLLASPPSVAASCSHVVPGATMRAACRVLRNLPLGAAQYAIDGQHFKCLVRPVRHRCIAPRHLATACRRSLPPRPAVLHAVGTSRPAPRRR